MPADHIPDMEKKLALLQQTADAIGKEQAILKLAKQLPREELSFLADQLNGRELAKTKFPFLTDNPHILYPPSFYLEQTSSEKTARFKAGLVDGDALIDMTGGFGIDTYFFSQRVNNTWYIEQDPVIFRSASHNLKLLDPSIETIHADAVEFLETFKGKADWIYLDPIRRNKDRRLTKVQEFNPNIHEIQELLFAHARQVMIKLSPMLDITEAIRILSGKVSSVYVVAVDNECKELLIVSDGSVYADVKIESVHLVKGREERFSSSRDGSYGKPQLSEISTYLYEPNAAVFKTQQFDEQAARYGLFKLHTNTHLYTSGELHSGYEGRIYAVKSVHSFDPKAFKAGSTFNIKTRNITMTPAEVAKKLHLHEGGTEYLFCVRTIDEKFRAIICEMIPSKH